MRKQSKSKKRYTDEPIGDIQVIDDFLPSPDQLILKQESEQVSEPRLMPPELRSDGARRDEIKWLQS